MVHIEVNGNSARAVYNGIVITGPPKAVFDSLKSRHCDPSQISGYTPQTPTEKSGFTGGSSGFGGFTPPSRSRDEFYGPPSRRSRNEFGMGIGSVQARVTCSDYYNKDPNCRRCSYIGIQDVDPEKITRPQSHKCDDAGFTVRLTYERI